MNHYGLKMGDRMGIEFGTFHTNQVLTLLGHCVPFCLATCFIDEETEKEKEEEVGLQSQSQDWNSGS